ncbi:16S rRNA (guanine(966)-N(2))-methyltransferase RsmD [Chlamydiota bacterium]
MRIIAGKFKNRIVRSSKEQEVRPTLERIRESLFNIITPQLEGAEVLDLFAGTGIFGLEALSRGASSVVFVEYNKQVIRILKQNIASIVGEGARTRVFSVDVFKALAVLQTTDQLFDLIYADPPYFKEVNSAGKTRNISRILLQKLGLGDMLKPEGILILEHSSKLVFPETEKLLCLYRKKEFAKTTISFYKREEV